MHYHIVNDNEWDIGPWLNLDSTLPQPCFSIASTLPQHCLSYTMTWQSLIPPAKTIIHLICIYYRRAPALFIYCCNNNIPLWQIAHMWWHSRILDTLESLYAIAYIYSHSEFAFRNPHKSQQDKTFVRRSASFFVHSDQDPSSIKYKDWKLFLPETYKRNCAMRQRQEKVLCFFFTPTTFSENRSRKKNYEYLG